MSEDDGESGLGEDLSSQTAESNDLSTRSHEKEEEEAQIIDQKAPIIDQNEDEEKDEEAPIIDQNAQIIDRKAQIIDRNEDEKKDEETRTELNEVRLSLRFYYTTI